MFAPYRSSSSCCNRSIALFASSQVENGPGTIKILPSKTAASLGGLPKGNFDNRQSILNFKHRKTSQHSPQLLTLGCVTLKPLPCETIQYLSLMQVQRDRCNANANQRIRKLNSEAIKTEAALPTNQLVHVEFAISRDRIDA